MGKRKGLPKKYAKMGFKRGWAAYKRSKRKPVKAYSYKPHKRRKGAKMARAKKSYRRYTAGFGMKNIMYGAIAEAGADIAGNFLGNLSRPVVYAIAGKIGHNTTLQTIAGIELGNLIAGGGLGLLGGGNAGGGAFEG